MLILYFDYPSAAATVAVLRLQALADQGAPVAFRGIDVLGIERSIPATIDQLDEHERYRDRAAELGLELPPPRLRPPTLAAHLIGTHAESHRLGAAWRWACLTAYWREGADLGVPDVLVALAEDIGLDGDEVAGLVADRSALTASRRRMLVDRGRGIGGVPVLEVDGALVPADLPDADLHALAGL